MIPFIFKKKDSNDPAVMRGYELTYSYAMRLGGLYPDFRGFRYYIFGFHLNCIHVAYLWFILAYIISAYYGFVYNDMELVSYNICYGLLTIIFFLVGHSVMYKRNHLDRLFETVGKGFFTYEKPLDADEQAIVDECDMKCKKTAKRNILLTMVLTTWTCVVPPLPKALKGEYSSVVAGGVPINKHLPLPVWSPYPIDTPLTYWSMYALEFTAGITEAFIIATTCTLFCNLCTIVSRELKLLRLALRRTRSRANYTFKMRGYSYLAGSNYAKYKLFQQCMVHCIEECIKHHIALKKFQEEFQGFMGFPIFAIFSGTALTISSPMFMLLTMTEAEDSFLVLMKILQYSSIIFSFTCFLSSYCLFGQMITNESSLVHFAFYETPWIDGDLDFRRKVIMGMIHSRKPFILTAKGLAAASSETLVDISKTIFSCFNLLAATQ
uniref:Odorant receptor n=1 Tax=Adelphocoris suturalis TaxID=323751 RepID=A0A7T7FRS4_9HEMI|nr:olfactory receptor 46 [Adelphocoris suturalis]